MTASKNRAKLIKRLEIIRNYILLEDIDDLEKELIRLKEYSNITNINEVISLIERKCYSESVDRIENLIRESNKPIIWIDFDLKALENEINTLNINISILDIEKLEIEKILREFQIRHSKTLGHLIIKILHFEKKLFKNDKHKIEDIEEKERKYKENFDNDIKENLTILNSHDKLILKDMFRQATKLCHPDKFHTGSEKTLKRAEAIFKELNEANNNNDILKVKEILQNLKDGYLSDIEYSNKSNKDELKFILSKLSSKYKNLQNIIYNLKNSETYKLIKSIDNWDDYFNKVKIELEEELSTLNKIING